MNSAQLLDEINSIQRRTRDDLACGAWRWLTLWALLSLGFVVTLAAPSLHSVASHYWAAALPIGIAGTIAVDLLNPGADRRVRRREWPYWATAAGITVANVGGSLLLPPAGMLVWFWVVFAVGFGIFLRLEGEQALARALGVMAVAFSCLGLMSDPQVVTSVVMGGSFVVMLATGAWLGYRRETA